MTAQTVEEYRALNARLTRDINAANRRAYLADDLLAVQAADAFESWDRAWQLRKALGTAIELIEGLANQQAMPDDYYVGPLAVLKLIHEEAGR
jgi:hypothetical protein